MNTTVLPTKDDILIAITPVLDPEIGISIVDLGLIYNITVTQEGQVTVLMTLTSVGCPLFPQIADPMREKILNLPGITEVAIDLTFEPPWSPDKISESAKALLML